MVTKQKQQNAERGIGQRFAGESATHQPPARAEEEETKRADIEDAALAYLQKCGT
jgi:hypothetical protein